MLDRSLFRTHCLKKKEYISLDMIVVDLSAVCSKPLHKTVLGLHVWGYRRRSGCLIRSSALHLILCCMTSALRGYAKLFTRMKCEEHLVDLIIDILPLTGFHSSRSSSTRLKTVRTSRIFFSLSQVSIHSLDSSQSPFREVTPRNFQLSLSNTINANTTSVTHAPLLCEQH